MLIYIHTKCSTCQKAMAFLTRLNIKPIIKDITQEPPTLNELDKMLGFQAGNIKKLLNTSGKHYRELGLSSKLKNMSNDQILSLLSTNGMLIKRPFLIAEYFGLIGFIETEWSEKVKTRKVA